jgi:ferritin
MNSRQVIEKTKLENTFEGAITMISEQLLTQLNEQLNFEFFSSNLYLAKSAYCYDEDLDGFANFFRVQAEEEKFHAMKFFDFINDMGGRIQISGMPNPENQYDTILDAYEQAYQHEQEVTSRIYKLMDAAMEEKEHATISFLKWFIDEQVEEEAMFDGIIKRLQRIDDNASALYLLDDELAKRTFTPPKA